jgi:hypothetical protein
MTPCPTRLHRIAAAAAGLLLLAGCDPVGSTPLQSQEGPTGSRVDPIPQHPGDSPTPSAPVHPALGDEAPVDDVGPVDPTLDPATRDENVGVLSRADLDLLIATHPLVQQHLAAHPDQAATLDARIDEALGLASAPRVFFVAAGQRVAYPMSQIVAFRAEALFKLPDGSLATQALVVSAQAVSYGADPEPGFFLGLVSAPPVVPVTLRGVDASVFWANGPRNSAWSAYWAGHQEILTSPAGVDLFLGNLGFQKLGPLELVVPSAIATIDAAALPRLLRAAGDAEVQLR